MKRILPVVVLLLLIGLGWRYMAMGAAIATGYSAKQLCSGVYVAGLPENFVMERDIHPRMSILGAALALLQLTVNEGDQSVESRFLGFSSIARYSPLTGCTLNPLPSFTDSVTPRVAARPQAMAVPSSPEIPPPAELTDAFEIAFSEPPSGGRNTLALLVMHHGEVIAEKYLMPIKAGTPLQGWSMNKSLLATWVGMQVNSGRLSLDLPVLKTLQSNDEAPASAGHKVDPNLTLFNLLHMESGFDFEETYEPGDDATQMLYRNPEMWRAAPGRGHKYRPGEHFSYSSGDTNLAAYLWQLSLGGKAYYQWLEENFYQPLGLYSAVAEADASGVQVGSSYTYMSARDWARVGQFWLDAWHERTDLLPPGWQRQATRPNASNTEGNYGLAFWLNTQGSQLPSLPENVFYAGGNAGQRVMVFPDQELVIVRLGLSQTGVDQGVELFARQVLDIVEL